MEKDTKISEKDDEEREREFFWDCLTGG